MDVTLTKTFLQKCPKRPSALSELQTFLLKSPLILETYIIAMNVHLSVVDGFCNEWWQCLSVCVHQCQQSTNNECGDSGDVHISVRCFDLIITITASSLSPGCTPLHYQQTNTFINIHGMGGHLLWKMQLY